MFLIALLGLSYQLNLRLAPSENISTCIAWYYQLPPAGNTTKMLVSVFVLPRNESESGAIQHCFLRPELYCLGINPEPGAIYRIAVLLLPFTKCKKLLS